MADIAAALPAIGLLLFAVLVVLVAVIALHDRRARLFADGLLSILATVILAALVGLTLAGLIFLVGTLIGLPGWLLRLRLALP